MQICKAARERQILMNKGLTLLLEFKSEIFDISAPPHHPNQQSLWWIEGVLHGSRGIFISQTLCVLPGVLNSMICQPTIIVQAEYKSRREYYLADQTN